LSKIGKIKQLSPAFIITNSHNYRDLEHLLRHDDDNLIRRYPNVNAYMKGKKTMISYYLGSNLEQKYKENGFIITLYHIKK